MNSMNQECEKGIIIKASAVCMENTARDGQACELNPIGALGNWDFNFEGSRVLNACKEAFMAILCVREE